MGAGSSGDQRALQILLNQMGDARIACAILEALRTAGIRLADEQNQELVVRWVNVFERSVPSEADTIIRTITRTVDSVSTSSTHWLDGLRGPRF